MPTVTIPTALADPVRLWGLTAPLLAAAAFALFLLFMGSRGRLRAITGALAIITGIAVFAAIPLFEHAKTDYRNAVTKAIATQATAVVIEPDNTSQRRFDWYFHTDSQVVQMLVRGDERLCTIDVTDRTADGTDLTITCSTGTAPL